MHSFEYQITNSISVILIFELALFNILLGSNTFFGIRKVNEYQVFFLYQNLFLMHDFEYQITNS